MSTQYDETLCKFKKKVRINQFWKFYKINAVIAKESEKETWKVILLSILPGANVTVGYNILLEDLAIKVIEETRSSDSFDTFLSELFTNRTIRIGDTNSSTELIRFEPRIKSSDRFASKSLIGIEYPGDILYVIGADPDSDIYSRIKRYAERSLLIHDPPYESIEETICDLLKFRPNIALLDSIVPQFPNKFRPLIMIFGPRYIRFENGKIINDKLHIWTSIREGVDPRDIKISVIGKGTKSTNILRKLLKFDKMKFKKLQSENV